MSAKITNIADAARAAKLKNEPPPLPATPGSQASPPDPFQRMDRAVQIAIAKATSGLAPSVLGEAWMDWAVHMAVSPGKQSQLAATALRNAALLWARAMNPAFAARASEVQPDKRFASAAWQAYPFSVLSQASMMNWQWWQDATKGVHGVSPPHENIMAFVTGLAADMVSPSNFAATNPDLIAATVAQGGQNFVRGAQNLVHDLLRKTGPLHEDDPAIFEVGRNLATTPGKVVFRNDLIELIQYEPSTEAVHPEPILIVPAWIMKYYILDLSPGNSMVRYLTEQGFTVFIVSWKNPGAEDRDLSMDDYRRLGVMDAVDAVQAITGAPRMHGVGYCLGGTLLSIAASTMARDADQRFATVSLFAAQADFTEAGPLRLFINEAEITLIEDMMSGPGYLSSDQMAGSFALLRARDLIWAPAIRNYLMGESSAAFDLMAWNADATRMPFRMHSEYLRLLFLNNDLAEGRYFVGRKAIAISDIRAPMFVVGTEDDHVAPWHSVYKFHLLANTDVTFVLTSGGHNAGIVSEPGHADRHFRIACTPASAVFRDPEEWREETPPEPGSWWTAFSDWLARHSGAPGASPPMGRRSGPYAAICDAPGTYVLQK